MADLKISQLTSASTPLAGTEVVPIVQSGTTKKVPVSDLTAGRAISATQVTVSTGNVVIGTSGQGIDFSATPGTGTSELLNDYEEGDWTPTYYGSSTAGTTTYTTQVGRYTKVGRSVTVSFQVGMSNATGTGDIRIGGFPFTANASIGFTSEIMVDNLDWGSGDYVVLYMGNADAFARIYRVTINAGINETGIDTSCTIYGSFTYMT